MLMVSLASATSKDTLEEVYMPADVSGKKLWRCWFHAAVGYFLRKSPTLCLIKLFNQIYSLILDSAVSLDDVIRYAADLGLLGLNILNNLWECLQVPQRVHVPLFEDHRARHICVALLPSQLINNQVLSLYHTPTCS